MNLFCLSLVRTNFRKFHENANFEKFARTYFREFRKCRPNRENKFSRKLVLAKISTIKVGQFRIIFQKVGKCVFRNLQNHCFQENSPPRTTVPLGVKCCPLREQPLWVWGGADLSTRVEEALSWASLIILEGKGKSTPGFPKSKEFRI